MVALLLFPVLLGNKHALSAYPYKYRAQTVPKGSAGKFAIYYWKHALNAM